MKRIILSATLLFIVSALIAQQNVAQIKFKTDKYNYGTIKEDDGVANYEFEFTNTGTSPLLVQRVSTSCGCTMPDWPKEPIAPGKTGKIKIGYDPKGRPGPFTKTISVYTNADQNVIVLQISGEVIPHVKTVDEIYRIPVGDLRFERNHFALGRVFLNKTLTDSIKFINKSTNPVKVAANMPGMNYMTVKIVPQTVKPEEFGTVIITYNPKERNDWGFVVDRFTLSVNDQPINNNPITVTASIEEDYSKLSTQDMENSAKVEFNTTSYNFGTVNEGDPAEYDFIIKNIGKSDLIIRKVKASCGCTTVEPSQKILKPGESSSIKAMFRTNGYSGQQSKSITVITNDPRNSTTILRMSGTITKKQQ